jgi:hypothetical protein
MLRQVAAKQMGGEISVSSFLDLSVTGKWLFINLGEIICTSHPVPASFEMERLLTNKNIYEKILNKLEEIIFIIQLKNCLLLKTPVTNTTVCSVIALFI